MTAQNTETKLLTKHGEVTGQLLYRHPDAHVWSATEEGAWKVYEAEMKYREIVEGKK